VSHQQANSHCNNRYMTESSPRSAVALLILLAVIAAIVVLLLVTGWADDKASPGSKGRVPVTAMTISR
jgi:hypothetical protein